MKKAAEYQHHANECRTLANTAKAEHRELLLRMAETWEGLASGRVEQLDRLKRLERLDQVLGSADA